MKRLVKFFMPFAVMVSTIVSTLSFTASATTTPPDPNGDGTINISDAVFIEAYLSGNYEVSNLSALDFNGDYVVNKKDSIAVQRYIAGMSI